MTTRVFRLQSRYVQKICLTGRPPTLFGKTETPYSIADCLFFLLATARKDLKTALKQVNFQFPADVQAPRAFRVHENGFFELFLVSIGC